MGDSTRGQTGGDNGEEAGRAAPPTTEPSPTAVLALELKKGLPCVRCRYDLAGLSILSPCPECGTPVKATLLCIVDPLARELQPLRRPAVTAVGLVLSASMALLGAAAGWWPRIADIAAFYGGTQPRPTPAATLCAAAMLLSGLGAAVLVNPHARIPRRIQVFAVLGILCFPALGAVMFWLHGFIDAAGDLPYLAGHSTARDRSLARLLIGALAAGAILGLRPVARGLYTRSLLFRHGRADRQTLAAVALAVGVAALGDAAHLAAREAAPAIGDWIWLGGTVAIVIGSVFTTVGMIGVVVDVVRLAPVLLDPPVTLGSLVRTRGLGAVSGDAGKEPP